MSLNGNKFSKSDISGRPLWLVFFDTGCEYCQTEISNIKRVGKFDGVRICLVSSESSDSLAAFSKRHKLDILTDVQVLADPKHESYHAFNVTTFPTSILYDANGALIQRYKGVVKVKNVLRDFKTHQ